MRAMGNRQSGTGREAAMSRHGAETAVGGINGRAERRLARRAVGLLAAVFLASVPAATGAAPDRPPAFSITIDVSTTDCRTVTIDYEIEWQSLTAEMVATMPIELQAVPGSYLLRSAVFDLGKKEGHWKGRIRGDIGRESGFFDHQTYPTLSYQAVVDGTAAVSGAQSNVVAIPACVPMSPVSGPASGGTIVTLFGGATFGGPGFTPSAIVTVGSVTNISPLEVAADGTWLTFVAPPGPAGTCVPVLMDGLPFPLPSFCYDA